MWISFLIDWKKAKENKLSFFWNLSKLFIFVLQEASARPDVVILGAATVSRLRECSSIFVHHVLHEAARCWLRSVSLNLTCSFTYRSGPSSCTAAAVKPCSSTEPTWQPLPCIWIDWLSTERSTGFCKVSLAPSRFTCSEIIIFFCQILLPVGFSRVIKLSCVFF